MRQPANQTSCGPMQVQEERVDVGGAELWCATSGVGPPLILLHGGPGMSDNLGAVARMIDDLVTVHRFDQRACGRSTGDGAGQTVDTALADLESLRRHFGHDRWIVGGHSGGAALALAYATRHPDRTQAVVSIAGPGVGGSVSAPAARSFRERLSTSDRDTLIAAERRAKAGDRDAAVVTARLTWKTLFSDSAQAVAHRDEMSRFPRNDTVFHAIRASLDPLLRSGGYVAQLRGLAAPVLLLHGRDDPLPVEGSEALAAVLRRPTLAIVEGVGHLPWLEDADSTRRALRAFLVRSCLGVGD